MRAAPVHEQVIGALRALPAAIAIHRPVAPDDSAHARARHALQLGEIAGAGVRQRVAAVGERMHDELAL